MASHRRGPWSQAEDAYLCQLVHTQGALNWVRIAQLIRSRSPKQCRERYHQNLKPSLNHDPISTEEGVQIERLVAEMGKRWAEIARRLHGRSDNAVKNWWNGSMNRRRRLVVRHGAASPRAFHQNEYQDRSEVSSFARPARPLLDQPLTITPEYSSYHRHMDVPLPSPSGTEVSRADSVEGTAPSLVSDTGSTFSVSPRVAQSPNVELPPLHDIRGSYRDSRRPSLPVVLFPSNASDSEQRLPYESAAVTLKTVYPPIFPHESRQTYMDSRSHLPSAPPTPLQLPPIQSFASSTSPLPPLSACSTSPEQRDSRMQMSNLLC